MQQPKNFSTIKTLAINVGNELKFVSFYSYIHFTLHPFLCKNSSFIFSCLDSFLEQGVNFKRHLGRSKYFNNDHFLKIDIKTQNYYLKNVGKEKDLKKTSQFNLELITITLFKTTRSKKKRTNRPQWISAKFYRII